MQGVSFHVNRTGIQRAPTRDKANSQSRKELLSIIISAEHAQPTDFTKSDIRRLMADFGRQEVHTLVSDAIDAAVHWKQVTDSLERNVSLDLIQKQEARQLLEDEVGALLAARKTLRLWRHRMQILEMIADAQRSLITMARSDRK
jgi:hypothetical protein